MKIKKVGNAMYHFSLYHENKSVMNIKNMKKRTFDAHSNAAMEFVVEEFVFGLHISQSAMLRTQIPHVSCS